jgi:nicotinamide mononucleotide (NMN) deamidase PncC
LATNCRQRFASDYALSIGSFPPAGDVGAKDEAQSAPEYYFALATPDKVTVRSSTLASHPSIWKPRAAKQALNLLRLHLIERG